MAITPERRDGPVTVAAGSTTGTITVGGAYTGQILVFGFLAVNSVSSVTDSRGNTYASPHGVTGATVNSFIFACDLTEGTPLQNGDTITVTFSAAIGPNALIWAEGYTGLAAFSAFAASSTKVSGGGVDFVSTTVTMPSPHALLYGVAARIPASGGDPAPVFTETGATALSATLNGATGGTGSSHLVVYAFDAIRATAATFIGTLEGEWSPSEPTSSVRTIAFAFRAGGPTSADPLRAAGVKQLVTAEARNPDVEQGATAIGKLIAARYSDATPETEEATVTVHSDLLGVPLLCRDRAGREWVVSSRKTASNDHNLEIRRSMDLGRTWEAAQVIEAITSSLSTKQRAAAFDRTGPLVLILAGSLAVRLRIGQLDSDGTTWSWSAERTAVTLTGSESLTAARLVRLPSGIWLLGALITTTPKLFSCRSLAADGTGTWTDHGAIVAGAWQNVTLFYDQAHGLLLAGLYRASEDRWYLSVGEGNGASWTFGAEAVLVEDAGSAGQFQHLAGRLRFVYVNETNDLVSAECESLSASGGTFS